uniref:WD repeat, SAM and U-box domain-containing protein 1 n=1 Tax=Periophthalmus magnuspinnatus TaxID=409849 RepID=A0A3B3ZT60_9GOBI
MVSVVCTLDHHANEVSGCAFSASLLASCSGDKTLRVYSAVDFSERPYSPLCGHEYGVHCCCFTSCGSYLLSCSTDGAIAVWSTDTGARVSALEHPSRSPLRACAVAPDSSLVLGGACDGTAALWDFSSGTLRRCAFASVAACCFSPCAQMFVTGSTHGTLRLWGVDGSILCVQKDAHDLGVTCCSFAPQFTVGTCLRTLLLHTLTGQSAPVLSCAFSSDGALVLCMFWFRYVTAVAMSPTKPWLATGSMDRTVKLPSRSTLTLLSDWSEEDVQTWLREEGLEELVGIFKSNNIDGSELSRLNRESAAEMGIESVGLRGRLLRKVESLKAAQSGSDGPDEFLGPITRELMRDPVIAADGYSYEREAIESWIRGKTKTSPMTNLPLQTTLLIPNRSLKMAIARWKSSQ